MKKIHILFLLILLASCKNEETIDISSKIKNEPVTHESQMQTGTLSTGTLIQTGLLDVSQTGIELSGSIEKKTPELTQIQKKDDTIERLSDPEDESITKYVNDTIHYTQINYTPKNLVKIKSEYVLDTKGNQTLREEANAALQVLAQDFFDHFQVKMKVVSAYRSYNYQVGIKKGGCSDLYCAKAGYSEHQSGLAFDMFEATSEDEFLSKSDLKKYYEWMEENAYKYGFNNSYKNGKKIDGYAIEPWHWRYLGRDFAQELQEKDMTYGEYFRKYGQK